MIFPPASGPVPPVLPGNKPKTAGGIFPLDPADAIRFLAEQAKLCRDRDDHEALCLLLPALMRVLQLRPMNGYEAAEFRRQFKEALQRA